MKQQLDARSRRSQLNRWHQKNGADFDEFNGGLVVRSYNGQRTQYSDELPELCDLSLLPRTGMKGRGAPLWISSVLDAVPEKPNTAVIDQKGTVIARLSNEEFLVVGSPDFDSSLVTGIDEKLVVGSAVNTYRLPQADSHCLLSLSGQHSDAAMAKLCGVDLRPKKFANGAVAQTSVARVNAIVIRYDLGSRLGYYILSDSTSAEYLWTSLIDAIDEYSGAAVGVAAIQQHLQPNKE